MNIIVCIKQVPDTTSVSINPETNTIIREGIPSIINPFDTNAIETALQLKEKYGGKTTVITMGPPQAEKALREAISMGIDNVYLISDSAFAGSDTLVTAVVLGFAIEKIGFDLIICGKQAIDGDTAQVGPELAELLGIPHISYVCKLPEIIDGKIIAERELEESYETIETVLPSLITVTKQINEPRMPSLKRKIFAKNTNIPRLTKIDLDINESFCGLSGSPTRVNRIFVPEKKEGRRLTGSPEKMVSVLIEEIKTKGII
ncbi:TPA: electron transfer flavoprotein subunit beta [bacterium]|nr:electron transfer flavoprotein subunit beta [bacterium]